MIKILCLIVFLLLVLVHLYACFIKNQRLRMTTKPFLMVVLAVNYALNAESFSTAIFAALLMGCIGDCFLLFPEKKSCFFLGLLGFGVGHVLYILRFSREIGGLPLCLYILLPCLCILAVILTFLRLKPYLMRKLYLPCVGYMIVIASMSMFAALRFFALPGVWSGLVLFGALVFLLSDTILSFEIFKGETPRGNFRVMLTYLMAQSLIAFGMAFA